MFEGGGMRASYSCAVPVVLLENNIYFTNVYGVSAGASNAVNYITRDTGRTRSSFTDIAGDPRFGNIKTFLQRKGIFNSHYIYQESWKEGGPLPFREQAYFESTANVTIESFERDTGKTVYWTRKDMNTCTKLMTCVQASSSLPFVMPPTFVDDSAYYDGGLGEGSGIMMPRAQADGFERFVVVTTRPKGYRKQEKQHRLLDLLFWRRPYVRSALATRAARYNAELECLDQLERAGRAFVFYADEQQVENSEGNVELLIKNYNKGYHQAQQDFEALIKFLGA